MHNIAAAGRSFERLDHAYARFERFDEDLDERGVVVVAGLVPPDLRQISAGASSSQITYLPDAFEIILFHRGV